MTIKILNLVFTGPYNDETLILDQPGIYVIMPKGIADPYRMIDVGQSESLHTRIANHDRKRCWIYNTNYGGYDIYICNIYSPDVLTYQESYIRRTFNPVCGER